MHSMKGTRTLKEQYRLQRIETSEREREKLIVNVAEDGRVAERVYIRGVMIREGTDEVVSSVISNVVSLESRRVILCKI